MRSRHAPGTTAQTTTVTDSPTDATTPSAQSTRLPFPSGTTLRLRGEEAPEASREEERQQQESTRPARPRVRWDESVVNNEGLGRKSSKVCCIYHKPHNPGESSSEEDSSSSSDSDSDSDGDSSDSGYDAAADARRRLRRARHGHDHDGHDHHRRPKRRPSPNAYERMPKYNVNKATIKTEQS